MIAAFACVFCEKSNFSYEGIPCSSEKNSSSTCTQDGIMRYICAVVRYLRYEATKKRKNNILSFTDNPDVNF
jgi:hypothetical protein